MAKPVGSESQGRQLLRIPPEKIDRNPEHPRLIFHQEDMDRLAESIKEWGILVPLIVFPRSGSRDRYVLLDGERRWICALKLNLGEVPCNVIEPPDRVQNILRMFNIHNVRKDWDIMPTAIKLGQLMQLLGTIDTEALARVTGLSNAYVNRSKKLLTYDSSHQTRILEGEIKADFYIEMYPALNHLEHKFPAVYRKYGREGLIRRFLAKQLVGSIKAVTDFRLVSRIIQGERKGIPGAQIKRILVALLEDTNLT